MSELNLYQKIVQVRQVAEGFSKDKKSFGYSYVSGNQVLSKIKDKMNELNLLLMPSTQVGEHHTHAYKTQRGKDALDFVVKGEMSYTWINGDNPAERETVTWAYYGQQDEISKAYGSALTYSERYYLLKSLGLPTDEDDPDGRQHEPASSGNNQTSGGKEQVDKLTEKQVNRLFTIAKSKNISAADVKKALMKDYKKTQAADLTKKEYDELCGRLEAAGKEQKNAE